MKDYRVTMKNEERVAVQAVSIAEHSNADLLILVDGDENVVAVFAGWIGCVEMSAVWA